MIRILVRNGNGTREQLWHNWMRKQIPKDKLYDDEMWERVLAAEGAVSREYLEFENEADATAFLLKWT